jgi:hypothetical protein
MPGDPKECRQQALACIRLAQTSASPQARDRFASLAWTWIRLADDLERNLTVLEGLDDETSRLDPKGVPPQAKPATSEPRAS